MKQEVFERAQTPGHSSMVLLHQMTRDAHKNVVELLAAALVRREAFELADALAGEPLTKAREAAAEPLAAVEEAKQALAKEQHTVAARLAAFWKSRIDAERDDGAREPERETAAVVKLRDALAAAEARARPFTRAVRTLEEQIGGLRAAPAPDPATLAILGEALTGGHHEAD